MIHYPPLGRPALLVAALMAAASCAGAGRDFARPRLDDFALGKATVRDVVGRYGAPNQRASVVKDGREIVSLSYSYADPEAPSSAPGVAAVKAMALYFTGDVLVGYESLSTFKADSSEFDDTRVSDITKGVTTEAEVRQLVGRPSGMYIYPLTRAPDEHALVFLDGRKKAGSPLARKYLVITLDRAGIVRDVQFEKSGEW